MGEQSVNVHEMTGSNLVMGNVTGDVVASSTSEPSTDSLKNFLSVLEASLEELNLSQMQSREMTADIKTVETQLSSPNPKKSIVKECLKSIRAILEEIAGSVLAAQLLQMLTAL